MLLALVCALPSFCDLPPSMFLQGYSTFYLPCGIRGRKSMGRGSLSSSWTMIAATSSSNAGTDPSSFLSYKGSAKKTLRLTSTNGLHILHWPPKASPTVLSTMNRITLARLLRLTSRQFWAVVAGRENFHLEEEDRSTAILFVWWQATFWIKTKPSSGWMEDLQVPWGFLGITNMLANNSDGSSPGKLESISRSKRKKSPTKILLLENFDHGIPSVRWKPDLTAPRHPL